MWLGGIKSPAWIVRYVRQNPLNVDAGSWAVWSDCTQTARIRCLFQQFQQFQTHFRTRGVDAAGLKSFTTSGVPLSSTGAAEIDSFPSCGTLRCSENIENISQSTSQSGSEQNLTVFVYSSSVTAAAAATPPLLASASFWWMHRLRSPFPLSEVTSSAQLAVMEPTTPKDTCGEDGRRGAGWDGAGRRPGRLQDRSQWLTAPAHCPHTEVRRDEVGGGSLVWLLRQVTNGVLEKSWHVALWGSSKAWKSGSEAGEKTVNMFLLYVQKDK